MFVQKTDLLPQTGKSLQGCSKKSIPSHCPAPTQTLLNISVPEPQVVEHPSDWNSVQTARKIDTDDKTFCAVRETEDTTIGIKWNHQVKFNTFKFFLFNREVLVLCPNRGNRIVHKIFIQTNIP